MLERLQPTRATKRPDDVSDVIRSQFIHAAYIGRTNIRESALFPIPWSFGGFLNSSRSASLSRSLAVFSWPPAPFCAGHVPNRTVPSDQVGNSVFPGRQNRGRCGSSIPDLSSSFVPYTLNNPIWLGLFAIVIQCFLTSQKH